MILVISPAKTLDFENPPASRKHSQPQFLAQSQALNGILKGYSPCKLEQLMSISSKLAELNAGRNQQWQPPFSMTNAKQAVFAFRGDVYTGLDADSLDKEDLEFAQQHLRILSGLYGLLRPLDLIQPYRLEMGTRLPNELGKDLYAFWRQTLTSAMNKALKAQQDKVLINLASEEYFSALAPSELDAEIITPVFKDYKNGKYKIISFFAKKARGQMAAWLIKNRITDKEELQGFTVGGYHLSKNLSKNNEYVFTRKLE